MWRDPALLLDMLVAARRVQQYTAGLTWEVFEQSPLHQDAIIRVLEIVGEAARRVSPETRTAHPDIPWSEIIGMPHRLIHEYFRINLPLVWHTVQNNIPQLVRLLEPLVPPDRE